MPVEMMPAVVTAAYHDIVIIGSEIPIIIPGVRPRITIIVVWTTISRVTALKIRRAGATGQ